MTPRVEFFFDLSSPWTCLAFHNLPAVLDGAGASARYRPILVGGVFNAVNPAVYAARAQADNRRMQRSEEHTSELQSLMRTSYAVFCLKKKQSNQVKYIIYT